MVSRRNFATITLIMLVLFFLFQFSGAAKEALNNYGQNRYDQETESELTATNQSQGMNEDLVVYVGDIERPLYTTVSQWCGYTKRFLTTVTDCYGYQVDSDQPPEVIVIDSESVNVSEEAEEIMQWTQAGMHVVFGNLPEPQVVVGNETLMKLLGIRYVNADKIHLSGIHLFGGFLLGGEEFYQPTDESEAEMQDLTLDVPWYMMAAGTKSYMVGMLDEDTYGEIENEYLPSIIWRNSLGSARVFAVNGNYLEGTTGIGILDAMMSEAHDYEIYPVVNSQNMVILNYPMFSDENQAEMQRIYSRDTKSVLRDLVWSGIVAVAEQRDAKITGMMTPQLDYSDSIEPDEDLFEYFMKLMQEEEGETGVSLSQTSNTPIEEQLAQDSELIERVVPDYVYTSAYIGTMDAKTALEALEQYNFTGIRTVYTDYQDSAMPVAYYNDTITSLSTTNDGFSHTYSEDLRQKSLETALAYSSISADFSNVVYPTSDEDTWEQIYERFSSYTITFWKAFDGFDQTTISEADERVRNFMVTDYSDSREGNVITLNMNEVTKHNWFILRTHQQEITDMTGGSYRQIEEGAYLIKANKTEVTISVKDSNQPYYYNK